LASKDWFRIELATPVRKLSCKASRQIVTGCHRSTPLANLSMCCPFNTAWAFVHPPADRISRVRRPAAARPKARSNDHRPKSRSRSRASPDPRPTRMGTRSALCASQRRGAVFRPATCRKIMATSAATRCANAPFGTRSPLFVPPSANAPAVAFPLRWLMVPHSVPRAFRSGSTSGRRPTHRQPRGEPVLVSSRPEITLRRSLLRDMPVWRHDHAVGGNTAWPG
jgi:hypothetical protein